MRNVLFLCTGNSARSIMAEVILNSKVDGRFAAASAGSRPTGEVNPGALRQIASMAHDITGLRSKSWDEFSGADAPEFDLVITVCDNAAGESCPVWRGAPQTAHWGIPDPAAAAGGEERVREAFSFAYTQLEERINALLALDLDVMSDADITSSLAAIGADSG